MGGGGNSRPPDPRIHCGSLSLSLSLSLSPSLSDSPIPAIGCAGEGPKSAGDSRPFPPLPRPGAGRSPARGSLRAAPPRKPDPLRTQRLGMPAAADAAARIPVSNVRRIAREKLSAARIPRRRREVRRGPRPRHIPPSLGGPGARTGAPSAGAASAPSQAPRAPPSVPRPPPARRRRPRRCRLWRRRWRHRQDPAVAGGLPGLRWASWTPNACHTNTNARATRVRSHHTRAHAHARRTQAHTLGWKVSANRRRWKVSLNWSRQAEGLGSGDEGADPSKGEVDPNKGY